MDWISFWDRTCSIINMRATRAGFEPATNDAFRVRYLNPLGYRAITCYRYWWGQPDSNRMRIGLQRPTSWTAERCPYNLVLWQAALSSVIIEHCWSH